MLSKSKKVEAALNSIYAILDEISEELGRHKGAKNREVQALESARTDLQKAAELILTASRRF